MLTEKAKIDSAGKYGGARVYIPSDIVTDSQFPFKIGEKVTVRIDTESKKLVIESAKE